MTFPTPAPAELTDKLRCVTVFIPVDSNAIFLSNLLAQYTDLIPPYQWDGTYEEKGNISQLWQNAYALTYEWLEANLCAEIIDEDGNVSIDVNVNTDCGCGGGCGGGGGTTVNVNNYITGTGQCLPIETSPVPLPTVPPLVPDGVGGYEPPPPIYPDDPPYDGTTEEYNQERCTLAEYAFEWLLDWVTSIKELDNIVLTASAMILALGATGVSAVISMLSKIAPAELIQLVSSIVGLASVIPLWDEWLDDAIAVIESRKTEFICSIYGDGDTIGATEQWVEDTINEIIADWQGRPDWSQDVFSLAFQFLQYLLPATPLASWARLNNVAINFVPTFDCSTCGGGGGGVWSLNVDASEYDVGSTPLVVGNGEAEVTMSGNIIPVGLVGDFVATLSGYPVGMVGYDAVTFTMTPSYSPVVSGKRWRPQYGPEGSQFDLLSTSEPLDVPYTFVIYVSGTTPPAGAYDFSFAVSRDVLFPQIWYSTLAAGAIAVDVNTLVENFTLYETP